MLMGKSYREVIELVLRANCWIEALGGEIWSVRGGMTLS